MPPILANYHFRTICYMILFFTEIEETERNRGITRPYVTGVHLHPEARAHLKKMETKANIAKKKKGDREWNYRGLLD